MELRALYREIDDLLPARARDYPRRSEPIWSRLAGALEEAARLLRERVRDDPYPPSPAAQACATELLGRAVFVVGYKKSGTTLLLSLLDGHAEIGVLPHHESRWFTRLRPRMAGLDRTAQLDELQREWTHFLINPSGEPPFWLLGRPWELEADPYEQLTSYLYWLAGRHPGQDLLGVLATALVAVRLDQGLAASPPRYWLEKSTQYELYADEILATYPAARFVHVVRDPRGTVAALRKIGMTQDAWRSSAEVERSLAAALHNAERLGPHRYLVVRYEDIVRDTAGEMAKIANFVGVAFDETLLTPTIAGLPSTANSAWSERRVRGEVHTFSLESWRDALDPRAVTLVEARTGAVARALGYDLPRQVPLRRVTTLAVSGAERALRAAARQGTLGLAPRVARRLRPARLPAAQAPG